MLLSSSVLGEFKVKHCGKQKRRPKAVAFGIPAAAFCVVLKLARNTNGKSIDL